MNHTILLPEENTASAENQKPQPVFSGETLEDLSCRAAEIESLLDFLTQYGDFDGRNTATVVDATFRLMKILGEEIENALVLYKKGGAA